MARVLVPLADGVEEMEAVIIIDTLRRARWHVTAAAVGTGGREVRASRGVIIVADLEWEQAAPYDFEALLLPGGGGGTEMLRRHAGLKAVIREFAGQGKLVGAICAGPLVLQDAGVLQGRRATCHPSVRTVLRAGEVVDERVVRDGNILTSQGPGTAFEFTLAVIEQLDGPEASKAVAAGLVLPS